MTLTAHNLLDFPIIFGVQHPVIITIQARLELLRDMRLGGGKDEAGSSARREAGNAQFLAGDTAGAMVSYTRAVVLGPPCTQTLAAAFANR